MDMKMNVRVGIERRKRNDEELCREGRCEIK